MELKTNYHTHTTFCDGKNTPEEMVQAAIEKGFSILGFSAHSMYPHGADWELQPKDTEKYFSEIRSLSKKYSDRIKIYAGLEADYVQGLSCNFKRQFQKFSPDFLIGSVHYILHKNGFFTVDDTEENIRTGLKELFGGNGKKAVQEYFFLQREMLSSQEFLILGHADVIRKRNGALHFFNEGDSWYKKELKAAAKACAKAGVIVEINTGAISRGVMDDVYPGAEFLDLLHQEGVPVTFSSDAHTAQALDFAFDRAELAAVRAGYTEAAYFEDGSVKFRPLDGRLKY